MKSLIYKTLFASIFFVCSCEEQSNEKTTIEIGDVYQGGIVFYIDYTGEHGLIAAMEDVSTSSEWGCLSTYVDGADNLTLGSGYQNTLDIVDFNCSTENGSDNTASKLTIELVHNTYDDWYLPSINELELLINTLALNNNNIMNLDFNHEWAGYYWSSTLDGNRVYRSRIYGPTTYQSLEVVGSSYPEDSYFVRAIRAF